MSIPRGVYQIVSGTSNLDTTAGVIGRHPYEELSLRPKAIYRLHDGIQPRSPQWHVLPNNDGTYQLKACGFPTADFQGHVFAHLLPDAEADNWVITNAKGSKVPNCYTIEKKDRSLGWEVNESLLGTLGSPVSLKPLTPTKSDPPQYPPTQLFSFVRIDYSV